MKRSTIKIGALLSLVLLIGTFTSCKNTSKSTENEVTTVAENTSEFENTTTLEARKPIVFITGYDKGGNKFYSNARNYFKNKEYQIVDETYSLEEIINWMNSNATKNPYGEIHIVNYNNPFKSMSLETTIKGEKVTLSNLQTTIHQAKLPTLKNVVTSKTNIVFHSQALGEKTALMNTLKDVFVAEEVPNVIASPFYNIFGGEFKKHYLAQPYYVFYPTAHSPGKVDLSKEIAKKYANEKDINWFAALNNKKERYIGEPYTVQYNVPVKWEIDYTNSDNEIPTFTSQEAIMDWIEAEEDLNSELIEMGIIVDKFRWSWKVKNSKLTIKGKTTVLCVLKPLIKPYGDLEHIEPDTKNKRLYAMK